MNTKAGFMYFRHCTLLTLIIINTAIDPSTSWSESQNTIYMKSEQPKLKVDADGEAKKVIAIHDSISVCANPAQYETCKPKNSVFLQYYLIADELKVNQIRYLLLHNPTDDYEDEGFVPKDFLGWVSTEDLLISSHALRLPNTIAKKGLVINHWREAKKGGDQDLNQAVIYNGLHDNRERQAIVTLFQIRYIYSEKVDKTGKTFVLVGPIIELCLNCH